MAGGRGLGFGQLVAPAVAGGAPRRAQICPRRRPRCGGRPAVTAKWIQRSASVHIEAGVELVYAIYTDLAAMPKFSPWLREVRVLEPGTGAGEGAVSEWRLGARGLEFSWRARNTAVRANEVIAWESIDGLPNRGDVRFSAALGGRRSGTRVRLTVAFFVPAFVDGLLDNDFVGSFVERTLLADLRRFRALCLREHRAGAARSPGWAPAPARERSPEKEGERKAR